MLQEVVPGNIRRAEHFVAFLRRFVEHMVRRHDGLRSVVQESPLAFLQQASDDAQLERKPMQFLSDRLSSLLRTLEVTDVDEFNPLSTLADFGSLLATYTKGFVVIGEPYDSRNTAVRDPVMQLTCLDASIAIKPVFERFRSVVITSGTLSPITFYPKILDFKPVCVESLTVSLQRDCICPLIVTRGSDQLPVSSRYQDRQDPGVIRNYGHLLLDLAAATPDGIVGFFTSYIYMEDVVQQWSEMGILQKVMRHKLVFIETPDVVETSLALDNFKRACDCGRGAVFLSVARGKVAEGIDFDRHYGRCVVLFGVPYQYTESRILKARLEYLLETFQIRESDFLSFDAMRQATQCLGRVVRSKSDYGVMILADKRYTRSDKRQKLPSWIRRFLRPANLNMSVDTAVAMSRAFLKRMAQPLDSTVASEHREQALWSVEDVLRNIRKTNPGSLEGTRWDPNASSKGDKDKDNNNDHHHDDTAGRGSGRGGNGDGAQDKGGNDDDEPVSQSKRRRIDGQDRDEGAKEGEEECGGHANGSVSTCRRDDTGEVEDTTVSSRAEIASG